MWFREENIKISENLLIFPNEFGIITNGVWRFGEMSELAEGA